MEILDPGHDYLVPNYDGIGNQRITFMKRIGKGYPFNTGSPHKGTNCQELIRVEINRIEYLELQNKEMGINDPENALILTALKTVVWLFEKRAAKHHNKDFPYSIFHPDDLYKFPTGPDGHVLIDLFQPLIDEARQPWRVDEGE